MKRGLVLFSVSIILILSISLISADWLDDLWGKITGKAEITGQATAGTCSGKATECQVFTTQSPCQSQMGCSWVVVFAGYPPQGFCQVTPPLSQVIQCSSITNQTSCQTQQGCTWTAATVTQCPEGFTCLSLDNQSTTLTFNYLTYEIELTSASDTSATIKLKNDVLGIETKEINEGQSKEILGLNVSIKSADKDNLKFNAVLNLSLFDYKVCVDSDNGINYTTAGKAYFVTKGTIEGYAYDYCKDNFSLAEAYCSSLSIYLYSFNHYNCTCLDGACIDSIIDIEDASNFTFENLKPTDINFENIPLVNYSAMGNKKLAIILIKYKGAEEPFKKDYVNEAVNVRLKKFIETSSYGKASLDADIYGWYNLNYTCLPEYDIIFNKKEIIELIGNKSSLYDGYIIFIGGDCDIYNLGVSTASFEPGSEGILFIGTKDLKQNISTSYSANSSLGMTTTDRVLFHEYGHLLGQSNHSAFFGCDITKESCHNIEETGNYIDIMGTGWFARDVYDFNAETKEYFGWLNQSDFDIIKNSGIYKIRPVEDKKANFFLVDTKKDREIDLLYTTAGGWRRYYLIEYRAPLNYDVDLKRGNIDNSGIAVYITTVMLNKSSKTAKAIPEGIIDTTPNASEKAYDVPSLSVSPLKSRYDVTIGKGEEFFDEENGIKIKNLGANSDGSYNIKVQYVSESEISENKKNICENGCELDGQCYSYNSRKNGNYCAERGEWVSLIANGRSCGNNFECSSNICVSGKCSSGSVIQKIGAWFRERFG